MIDSEANVQKNIKNIKNLTKTNFVDNFEQKIKTKKKSGISSLFNLSFIDNIESITKRILSSSPSSSFTTNSEKQSHDFIQKIPINDTYNFLQNSEIKDDDSSNSTLNEFYNSFSGGDYKFNLVYPTSWIITIEFNNEFNENSINSKLNDSIKEYSKKGFDFNVLKLLVQSIDLPNLTTSDEPNLLNAHYGYSAMGSKSIIPDSSDFVIHCLNTEYSLQEHIFLDWLNETVSESYVYPETPYRKARIRIDFLNQEKNRILFTYVLEDCFPKEISTINPNHNSSTEITRPVKFSFNWMWVDNKLTKSKGV